MSDLISRQAAIEALEEPCKVSDTWTDEYAVGERMQWEKDVKALNSLPSAQQDCTECAEYDHERHYCQKYCDVIRKTVEEVQPERKTGHWIKTARWGRVYYCDQCRNYLDFGGVNAGRGSTNFCPNCGADMREGES